MPEQTTERAWPSDLDEVERLVIAKLEQVPGLSDRQLAQRLRGSLSRAEVRRAWIALSDRRLIDVQHQPYKRRLIMRLYPRKPLKPDGRLSRPSGLAA